MVGPNSNNVEMEESNIPSSSSAPAPPHVPASTMAMPPPHAALYTYSSSLTGRSLAYFYHTLTRLRPSEAGTHCGAALAGFSSLLLVTAANSVLGPIRDAAALTIGVQHIPTLTLASTVLALSSAVPIGWLFEAPDPNLTRRRFFRRMGLTRGETQGTSLALFYRCFAIVLVLYSAGFKISEIMNEKNNEGAGYGSDYGDSFKDSRPLYLLLGLLSWIRLKVGSLIAVLHMPEFGKIGYVMFYLLIHLMKLHAISLIWGVVGEAMEYEEYAENLIHKRQRIIRENEALHRQRLLIEQLQSREQRRAAEGCSSHEFRGDFLDGSSMKRNNTSETTLASLTDADLATTSNGDSTPTMHPLYIAVPSSKTKLRSISDSGSASRNDESRQATQDLDRFAQREEGDIKSSSTTGHSGGQLDDTKSKINGTASKGQSRTRLARLAFVGLGGTIGGIAGSFVASLAAHTFKLSDLLLLASALLFLSANLSVELGKIMQRHWEEQQRERSADDLMLVVDEQQQLQKAADIGLGVTERAASITVFSQGKPDSESFNTKELREVDASMKRVSSCGSMKRVASGNSLASNTGLKRIQSGSSLSSQRMSSSGGQRGSIVGYDARRVSASDGNRSCGGGGGGGELGVTKEADEEDTFSRRLLRGVTTILRSKLLMAIFTYNALYASTTVLLSFQRAELVANRAKSLGRSSTEADTAFLAGINVLSNMAVFALQASGLGAAIAHSCGQRGTLALMPIVRLCGILILAWWHIVGYGKPPNLTYFLMLDEFTRVINFAVAKPVREGLWRGLSNEARYEAKPIVDTLANRWGSGSAAFLVSLLDRILNFFEHHPVAPRDEREYSASIVSRRNLFGFPPVLVLCFFIATWWAVVSAHVGHIRRRIDLELKKKQ